MRVLSAEVQHVLPLPGKQAEVLNILVEDVMQGHPVSEQRLKEVLGHNPLEVGLYTLRMCCQGCATGTSLAACHTYSEALQFRSQGYRGLTQCISAATCWAMSLWML